MTTRPEVGTLWVSATGRHEVREVHRVIDDVSPTGDRSPSFVQYKSGRTRGLPRRGAIPEDCQQSTWAEWCSWVGHQTKRATRDNQKRED